MTYISTLMNLLKSYLLMKNSLKEELTKDLMNSKQTNEIQLICNNLDNDIFELYQKIERYAKENKVPGLVKYE